MKINIVNTGLYTGSAVKATKSQNPQEDKFIKSEFNNVEPHIYEPIKVRVRRDGKDVRSVADYDRALTLFASAAIVPSVFKESIKTLSVIYTNDIHGAITPMKDDKNPGAHVGGVAYAGSLVKELKNKSEGNYVLLDGGDWGQGSYESKLTKGKTMVDVMNNMGYDAGEIGNHEFDWGRAALKDMIDEAKFPVLGANILENGNIIEGVKPYTIKEVNGLKVGIIGLISPETPGSVDPKNITGLKFASAKETVEKYIPELKEKGADMIFVLSHQGDMADERLASSVTGIDLIVGGHSHTLMEDAKKVNETLIVQAGTQGEKVGTLNLAIDTQTKKIVSFKNTLIPVTDKDIKPDPEIEKIISSVVNEAKEKMSEVVGKSEVDLTHDRKKVLETVMGNVVTDSMRESTGADVAMQNSGGIRDQIMAGELTMGDLYRVMPFDKFIVSMDLTGKQIKDLMEKSADRKKGNLQVSGITMDIEPKQAKWNKVSNVKIGGVPLDINKVYRVTTDDFLAAGANGYNTFTEGKNVTYMEGPAIDEFKAYIKKHSPLTQENAKIEGRLNFLSPPPSYN
jgi:2',3'-cyclic-nucleotide 2'-phosphodiesterase (5'-nucleotidase family)